MMAAVILTRGERLNNPGNIRIVPGVAWLGAVPGTDDAFVTFSEPVYGIRAIVRIMRSYQARGINTVQDAIDRWAPPNENNSAAYVQAVCADCKVLPTAPVVLDSIMPQLVAAIITHENGRNIYSSQQIGDAISLA